MWAPSTFWRRLIDDQLHHRPARAPGQIVAQRREPLDIDVDRAEVRRLVLGQADGGDRRHREHRGRDVLQHHPARPVAEQRVGQGVALGGGDRGQVEQVGDVAEGKDVRLAGLQGEIHDHRAAAVEPHAGAFQPQAVHVRMTAGGKEHQVGLDRAAIRQVHQARASGGLDPRNGDVRVQDDTLGLEGVGQRLAQFRIEAAKRQRLAIDQVHLGAQRGEDAGELDRDVAAAEDDDPARQLGQVERRVGNDAELGARNVQPRRVAAGGDDDALGGDALAADIQRMRVDEGRARIEHGGAGLGQQAAVAGIQPVDLAVLGGDQPGPVMRALADIPAEADRVLGQGAVFAGLDQQLLRHAADIDAGAAPEALLGNADARAVAGGYAGAADSAGAAADNEQVVVHCLPFRRPGALPPASRLGTPPGKRP